MKRPAKPPGGTFRGDELAARIRTLITMDPRVTEKAMFGSMAFLMNGHILVAARRTGASLMAQVGKDAAAEASTRPGVSVMTMRGRQMANFINIEDDSLDSDDGLQRWITLAEQYVAHLPDKK